MLTIFDFKLGQKLKLLDFGQTPLNIRQKLLSLGVTRGVEIQVIQFAPLGCPVLIEVRGTSLALRRHETCHLQWEEV